MHILGINAHHANASAAIVCDGQLVAAVEEERFNRVKYAAGFPIAAIQYCLDAAGLRLEEVDHVAIPRNPWARLARKLFYAVQMPRFALERARVMRRFSGMREELAAAFEVDPARLRAQFHRVEHHRAHLASTFFVSPFERAAVLSADGLGDFASTLWGTGIDNQIEFQGAIAFPHSLGMYYTAITQYLGFWKFGDEYKVMGLAAYGEPVYREEFRRIVRAGPGVSFRLGLEYFIHQRSGPDMTWREANQTPVLGRLFSAHLERQLGPTRAVSEPLEQRHRDVAATQQAALEDVLFSMLNALHKHTGHKTLCLAGGVAFNCVANGKIFSHTPFEQVYIQPAAGDAGLAIGAAYYVHNQVLQQPRSFVMDHAYWGPGFRREDLRHTLEQSSINPSEFRIRELPEEHLVVEAARHLSDGKIVGWFQGRMEWGPRALGNRSILTDPRRPEMKDILNRRIKHREPFRPFAPSILEEAMGEYFDGPQISPFMQFAYPVRQDKRELIPAPTHVDGTGRLQTVSREANPRYWHLLSEFGKLSGVPAVLNTSFNENEPIVCWPEEAIDCFLRTQMDVLVLGEHLIEKKGASDKSVGI